MLQWSNQPPRPYWTVCSTTWPNKSAQAVLISPAFPNSFIPMMWLWLWVVVYDEFLSQSHHMFISSTSHGLVSYIFHAALTYNVSSGCIIPMQTIHELWHMWKCEEVRNSFAVAWIPTSLFLYANSPLKGVSREEEWWLQVRKERRGLRIISAGGCWRNRWWRDTDSLYSIYSSIASPSQHPHPC